MSCPRAFFLIFIIQHVIYSFVAGHFVATKLVSELSAGKSFCSYVRVARADVVRICSDAAHLLDCSLQKQVISCFVAGHFVAIQSVFQFSEGISHGLLLDYLPPSETTKCFPGSKKTTLLQNVLGFYVVACYPQKSSYKMVAQPDNINPHTSSKKLACYKMVALSILWNPVLLLKWLRLWPQSLSICS